MIIHLKTSIAIKVSLDRPTRKKANYKYLILFDGGYILRQNGNKIFIKTLFLETTTILYSIFNCKLQVNFQHEF